MSAIWFTIVGIALYFVSDWLLQRVEASAGRRFEHRSLIFFVILLSLALITFSFIQQQTGVS
jgi:amino acid permease